MIRAVLCLLLIGPLASIAAAASVYDDDFADGIRGSQWVSVVDDASHLSIAESSGHLNLISAGGGDLNNDALYLSTFKLSTASDFTVRINYALTGVAGNGANGDKLGLTFGVGRDLDGTDSAAIGAGFGNLGGFVGDASTIAYRVHDAQTSANNELLSPLTGTFEINYVSSTDVLSFSRLGSGFTASLPAGTVRTSLTGWQADALFVSFGGRGSGLSATAGQLYVDDFSIVNGTTVPEPACLTLLSVGGFGLLRRRTAKSIHQ